MTLLHFAPKNMKTISLKRLGAAILGNLRVPIGAFAIVVPIAYTVIGAYSASRYNGEAVEIRANTEHTQTLEKLKESLQASPTTEALSTENEVFSTTIFSTRTIKITAYRPKPTAADASSTDIAYKLENSSRFETAGFLFAAGAWLLGLYLMNWAVSAIRDIYSTVRTTTDDKNEIHRSSQPNPDATDAAIPSVPPEIGALERDVEYCRVSATRSQQQASVLVVSGVAMALLGVVVFYYSLPPFADIRSLESSERLQMSLLASFRPALALLFIEGVAWFLLRQYRLQTIDFKDHIERASTRTDVLACVKIVDSTNDAQVRKDLIASLLRDKSTPPLKAGESTATLEIEKLAAANPPWQLAEALIKKIPDAGQK